MDEEEEFVDLPPAEFLRDLSEKLRHVPCIYDFDQYHTDHLIHLARMLEGKEEMHSSVVVADVLTAEEIARVTEHDVVVSITEPIVHILYGHYTYCGITKAPGHWGAGHSFRRIREMGMKPRKEPRSKFKDWKEGEARVKAHVVTPTGASLDMYIPHLTKNQGAAAIIFLSCIMSNNGVVLDYINRDGEREKFSSVTGDITVKKGDSDESTGTTEGAGTDQEDTR